MKTEFTKTEYFTYKITVPPNTNKAQIIEALKSVPNDAKLERVWEYSRYAYPRYANDAEIIFLFRIGNVNPKPV